MVELATTAEATTGTDTTRAITPAGLKAVADTKAATSHTHTASQVSDSTATGLALLTAVDAAAARTALGLGTAATTADTALATRLPSPPCPDPTRTHRTPGSHVESGVLLSCPGTAGTGSRGEPAERYGTLQDTIYFRDHNPGAFCDFLQPELGETCRPSLAS